MKHVHVTFKCQSARQMWEGRAVRCGMLGINFNFQVNAKCSRNVEGCGMVLSTFGQVVDGDDQ